MWICTYSALADLRLVAILENFEVINESADLKSSPVPFLNVGKIEQDILCVAKNISMIKEEAHTMVLPLIDALRNHAVWNGHNKPLSLLQDAQTHLRDVGADTVDDPFVRRRDDTSEGGYGVRRCLGAQDLTSEEVRLPEKRCAQLEK
jgi:hypothetical protein